MSRFVRSFPTTLCLCLAASTAVALSAQTCIPLPAGAVAWWDFDETSGTIAHDLIGDHSGVYFGRPVPTLGMVGGALRFNGVDNYIGVADSDAWAFGTSDFTIECWVNLTEPAGGDTPHPGDIFIGNDEGPSNRNKWFLSLGANLLNFHINAPNLGPKFFPQATFTPGLGEWHHLALTRNGSLYTIYIDGEARATQVNTDTIPNPDAFLTIGQAEGLGYLRGILDELTIYNRALAADEIQSIASGGSAGKCKPLGAASVTPNHGGDTGSVTLTIRGQGFSDDSRVSMVRAGEVIAASQAGVGKDSTTLSATFDLRNKARGLWDIRIDSPNGDTFMLRDGFTIEQGRVSGFWFYILGPSVIRASQATRFQVVYGNNGNIDVPAQFLALSATPTSIELLLPEKKSFQGSPLRLLAYGPPGLFGGIPPGSVNSIEFQVRTPADLIAPLTLSLEKPDGASGVFGWNAFETETQQTWLNAENWHALVQNTRSIMGDSFGGATTFVANIASAPSASPQYLASFDDLLLFEADLLSTPPPMSTSATRRWQTTKACNVAVDDSAAPCVKKDECIPEFAANPQCVNDVCVRRMGNEVIDAPCNFVLTHGRGALDNRFIGLASKIKIGHPDCNIYVIDWSPLSSSWNPRKVSTKIDDVALNAKAILSLLSSGGKFSFSNAKFIGESFGTYVNAGICTTLDACGSSLAISPATVYGGYEPVARTIMKSRFITSWSLHTNSPWDTRDAMGACSPFLVTSDNLNSTDKHTAGIRWLCQQAASCPPTGCQWLDSFPDCSLSTTTGCWRDGYIDALGYHVDSVSCDGKFLAVHWPPGFKFNKLVHPVLSLDPNEKFGPDGAGALGYLQSGSRLFYSIGYSNRADATAPAQTVDIIDRLDTNVFDPQTVAFGPISFGQKRVVPDPQVKQFLQRVDLRPEVNLFVDVSGAVDLTTGIIEWHFTSIDPVTGKTPQDPTTGFLPPNLSPPEGDGLVSFSVLPKGGLPSGTSLTNAATIQFDTNQAINTMTWTNTTDDVPPASTVLPLPSVERSQIFEVAWQGNDSGSGVKEFTILVSENGGPFTVWLADTALTSSLFAGSPGKTYAFVSVARDQVGNVEATPVVAEATTRVVGTGMLYTVTPCRVLDTRDSTGLYGGPPLSSGVVRAVNLFGRCGIPNTATAVVANLTVTRPTAAGYVTLYASNQGVPATSTINFGPGQTRANNVILTVSSDGTVEMLPIVLRKGTVDGILDVSGYFE